MAVGIGLLILSFPTSFHPKAFYLNLSSSMPRGLYRVTPPGTIKRGERVIFSPPGWAQPFIYGRRWLPQGWPILKYVGALEGDTYCVQGKAFLVNQKYTGPVFVKDGEGRALYPAIGRHLVEKNSFLPVSTHIPNSFDGRYFGTVPLSAIKGKASPVWMF